MKLPNPTEKECWIGSFLRKDNVICVAVFDKEPLLCDGHYYLFDERNQQNLVGVFSLETFTDFFGEIEFNPIYRLVYKIEKVKLIAAWEDNGLLKQFKFLERN